jgi:hypothetical protein
VVFFRTALPLYPGAKKKKGWKEGGEGREEGDRKRRGKKDSESGINKGDRGERVVKEERNIRRDWGGRRREEDGGKEQKNANGGTGR